MSYKRDKITIVGGNISGISTALALKKKGISSEIYEHKIWQKPCGGAFSSHFEKILLKDLGLNIEIRKIDRATLTNGWKTIEHIPTPTLILSRYDLQKKLYEYAVDRNISIHLGKRVNFRQDFNKFYDLTVVATGVSKFSLNALGRNRFNDLAKLKYFLIDTELKNEYDEAIYYVFPKEKGYAWYFPSVDGKIDIGVGGLGNVDWIRILEKFIKFIKRRYQIQFKYQKKDIQGWGLPYGIEKLTNLNLWRKYKGKTFIGVGDAIELADPASGAGIEIAWKSGQFFSSSCNLNFSFNSKKYFKLLENELNQHTRSRTTKIKTKFVRQPFIFNSAFFFLPASLLSYYFSLK
ncbi:MAG: hypothetical protein ACXAC7_04410 [Candidatus Hodarchaeales archaeon]|jgi:flavin-dependent dehydrogenase